MTDLIQHIESITSPHVAFAALIRLESLMAKGTVGLEQARMAAKARFNALYKGVK